MRTLTLALLFIPAFALADGTNTFVEGLAQGFQQSYYHQTPQSYRDTTQQRDIETRLYQLDSLSNQREQIDLQRQELRVQQDQNAWYNANFPK